MKFKNLLSLSVMLSCGLVSQAQVLQESFDAAQTKQAADAGFYEFINLEEGDEWKIETSGGFKNGALSIDNNSEKANDNSTWMRAVKFRNLPLQEGKSYRLTYYISGSSTYGDNKATKARIGLMQGVENADIAINNSIADISNITSDFVKHTHMFYFKNKAEQDAEYDKQCKSKEAYAEANKDKYFAVFNVYNPGQFKLDEVTLEEASIAGIGFNGGVICIDLGYASNIPTLAGQKSSGNYVLDNSAVTVKQDGKEIEPLSVELRGDGKIYIFFEEELSGEVEVTFTNPDGLIVLTNGPELTTITEKAVKNTSIDPDLEADVYAEASVESVTPENSSFGLETKDIKTITVTFDRLVNTQKTPKAGAPEAILSDGQKLTLKTTEKLSKTLTFEYNGADLGDGAYTITIKNIVNEYGTKSNDIELTYELGKVTLGKTEYTLVADNKTVTEAEGGIPTGWTLTIDGAEHAGGSGSRAFLYTDSNVQSAVYMRDWEGKPVVLTSSPVKIAAGPSELRVFTAGWGATGAFKVTLKDAAGKEVISQNVNVTTQLAKDRKGKFQIDPIRFESDGGEYTYSIELASGNEILTGGFEVYSVKEDGGARPTTEVIAKGDFVEAGNDKAPAHGTGWKIYRNDGRMRDPGANCSWGGDDWTGGGGPRVKTLGNKNMAGAGMYLAGGCYATYGEFLVQTDHAGALEGDLEEKTLDLKRERYQITYGIISWKNPGEKHTVKLEIFNQADGITGTPVFSRTDEVTQACGSGGDASADATKIQFLWNAPKEGKYILKFTSGGEGEGETVVGNVSIETTASLYLQYLAQMQKNLEPAIEERDLAKAKDEYKGATRDALEKMIADYENPDFHTVREFEDAFKYIETMTKKSAKRRSNIDNFASSLEAVKTGFEKAKGTKYEGLAPYPVVEKAYNDYKDVDYVALDDDKLNDAVSVMSSNGNLLSNMVDKCVPLITKQITDLAAAIAAIDIKLKDEAKEEETLLAAGNFISDDQSFVKQLKALYTAKIYAKLAAGENPFKKFDEDLNDEVETSIPVSFLIQNPNFYSTAIVPAGKTSTEAKTTDFPGWTIEVLQGYISPVFNTSWGERASTDVEPYVDCAVKTDWGTREYDVKQLIDMLPVAKYKASIVVGEEGGDPHGAYAYLGEGEAQVKSEYTGNEEGSYSRDNSTPQVFENVTPTINGSYGEITLGAHMMVTGGFGKVDTATLEMVGKADGFDYKAALDKLPLIPSSIDQLAAAPAGEPATVQYFGIDGKPTLNPQGVTIKVESWANGFVKISKVVK
ncbi:MAG: hypothetical protein Q4E26_00965 [Prevotellaceae bacterium]|nr:hypothetical protein [Prevotellaceae bacterium]